MPDNYVFSQFKLYAMIEDIGRVDDVVAISGNFALNTIPTASLILACGINATTNAQARRLQRKNAERKDVHGF
jgi:hypothetical protein